MFDYKHEDDFMEIDFERYSNKMWNSWLEHPENSEFKNHYHSEIVGEVGRGELMRHIFKPFELMNEIRLNHKDRWSFGDDGYLSVYTYCAAFGTGFMVPFLSFLIQIAVPILLILDKLDLKGILGYQSSNTGDLLVRAMLAVVLLLYLGKVVPDTLISFFNTTGGGDCAYSRTLSLLENVQKKNKIRLGQYIGKILENNMNTTYECILYGNNNTHFPSQFLQLFNLNNLFICYFRSIKGINIIILYRSNDVMDIILNALAIEFVEKIDEVLSASSWWDPNYRYIKAAAIELFL